MNKLAFVIVHIYLFMTLANISYMILTKKPIPLSIGYLTLISTILMVITTIYFVVTTKEDYHGDKERRLHHKHEGSRHRPSVDEIMKERGLHFDPKDPNYKPIGGIGGIGWV